MRTDYRDARAESGRPVKKLLLVFRQEMMMAHRGPQMEAVEKKKVIDSRHIFEGRPQCQGNVLIANKNKSCQQLLCPIGSAKHDFPHHTRPGLVV